MAHDAPDNSGQFRHCRQRLPLHDAAGQPPALGAEDAGDVDIGDVGILADNRLPWEPRTPGTWTSGTWGTEAPELYNRLPQPRQN